MNDRINRLLDRFFTPLLLAAVGLFVFWALSRAILDASTDSSIIYYTPQVIERVDPDTGVVSVPHLDGVDGPAVCLDDTVPVRGLLINTVDDLVPTTGNLIWERTPPGQRFFVLADVPNVVDPGTTELVFENPIPAEVVEFTLTLGEPTSWTIRGSTEVFWPNALPATYETARFAVTDCG